MFQLFHADVAKVARDVAYVAMVIHACCKHMFQMFHLFLKHVASVFILGVTIWTLYMFCNSFLSIFLDVFVNVSDV